MVSQCLQASSLGALYHGATCAPGQELDLLEEDILWELKELWLSCCPTKGAISQININVNELEQHLVPSADLSSKKKNQRSGFISAFQISRTVVGHPNLELCMEGNSKTGSSSLAELTQYKPALACPRNSQMSRMVHFPRLCSCLASSVWTCLILQSAIAGPDSTLPIPLQFLFISHSTHHLLVYYLINDVLFIACCLFLISRMEAPQEQSYFSISFHDVSQTP